MFYDIYIMNNMSDKNVGAAKKCAKVRTVYLIKYLLE